MAIPCASCGRPVNEHVVMCPHCGDATGVAPDTKMTYEERAAQIELDRVKAEAAVPKPSYLGRGTGMPYYDPEVALIGGAAVAVIAVGAAVKSAVEAVVHEHAERDGEPAIPRAIAHERKSAPVARPDDSGGAAAPEATRRSIVVPDPSHEPEPAPPPSDKPRFLK